MLRSFLIDRDSPPQRAGKQFVIVTQAHAHQPLLFDKKHFTVQPADKHQSNKKRHKPRWFPLVRRTWTCTRTPSERNRTHFYACIYRLFMVLWHNWSYFSSVHNFKNENLTFRNPKWSLFLFLFFVLLIQNYERIIIVCSLAHRFFNCFVLNKYIAVVLGFAPTLHSDQTILWGGKGEFSFFCTNSFMMTEWKSIHSCAAFNTFFFFWVGEIYQ